ncbi:MAG: (2Fe-2S)-binding protein [Pseudomonadales bacterium]
MPGMIVCVCKNVNSRQVRECLGRGMSVEDMVQEMGLGTGCGCCIEYACHVAESESAVAAKESAAA